MLLPDTIHRAMRIPMGSPPYAFNVGGLMEVVLEGDTPDRAERLTCLIARDLSPDAMGRLFRTLSDMASKQAMDVFLAQSRDGKACVHMFSPTDGDESAAALALLEDLIHRLSRAEL